ncbi:30S ribosome-binding factor RbfA [Anaerobiospirillum succiniciproducens]|uniref:30S ribosome-binding factor RbfA n=1 Tax=Anaerobiospirillum succiniciproducens TaxID=13335 RepID=UPI002942EFDE|nr:30S ribosome-binding factor RbfA [Anaerobiospirillum succiniciproducens]
MPKSYGRNERIAASLRREAARILASEIKDPRVKLATVTEVNVAPDLRNATIFVSFLDDDETTVKEAMQVLNKAAGFVRSTMAARLKMRYMPNIEFEFDSLVKDSMKLDALIAKGLGPKDEEARMSDVDYDDKYDNEYEEDYEDERDSDKN